LLNIVGNLNKCTLGETKIAFFEGNLHIEETIRWLHCVILRKICTKSETKMAVWRNCQEIFTVRET
jgi:hypothetical protein